MSDCLSLRNRKRASIISPFLLIFCQNCGKRRSRPISERFCLISPRSGQDSGVGDGRGRRSECLLCSQGRLRIVPKRRAQTFLLFLPNETFSLRISLILRLRSPRRKVAHSAGAAVVVHDSDNRLRNFHPLSYKGLRRPLYLTRSVRLYGAGERWSCQK